MKWSIPVPVPSIGIRVTADQAVPVALVDLLKTMSLALQPRMKRQSVHATYTTPDPSISADGSGPSRRLPATVWCLTVAIVVTALHVSPPLVELKAPMAV